MITREQEAINHARNNAIALETLEAKMEEKNLPEPSRIRLRKAFARASNTNGMKSAINAELRYVAQLEDECCSQYMSH